MISRPCFLSCSMKSLITLGRSHHTEPASPTKSSYSTCQTTSPSRDGPGILRRQCYTTHKVFCKCYTLELKQLCQEIIHHIDGHTSSLRHLPFFRANTCLLPPPYIWPHTSSVLCLPFFRAHVLTSPSLSPHFFSAVFALLQGQCAYLPLPIATLLQCCICPSSGPMFCGVYTFYIYILVCVYKIYVYIGMYYTI